MQQNKASAQFKQNNGGQHFSIPFTRSSILTFFHPITLLWNKQKHLCDKVKSGTLFSSFPRSCSCDNLLIVNSFLYVHSSFSLLSFSFLNRKEIWQKWKISSQLRGTDLREFFHYLSSAVAFLSVQTFPNVFPVRSTALKAMLIQYCEIKQKYIQQETNM